MVSEGDPCAQRTRATIQRCDGFPEETPAFWRSSRRGVAREHSRWPGKGDGRTPSKRTPRRLTSASSSSLVHVVYAYRDPPPGPAFPARSHQQSKAPTLPIQSQLCITWSWRSRTISSNNIARNTAREAPRLPKRSSNPFAVPDPAATGHMLTVRRGK